jgi:hypothetical protein
MTAHDKIRLIGQLREAPASAGAFYVALDGAVQSGKSAAGEVLARL